MVPTTTTPQSSRAAAGRSGVRGKSREQLRNLAPLAVVLTMAIAVSVRDPHQSGMWPACPTHALLGIDCPGCGSMRALHDLTHGHVAESIGHNALLIPGLLFLAYAAVRRPGSRWAIAWGIAFAVFVVLRNLPGSPLAA